MSRLPTSHTRPTQRMFKINRRKNTGRQRIPAALRNLVWQKYVIDKNRAFCFCCRYESISYGNFECGHIISVKMNGVTNIRNLRPICSLCNKSMGTRNMYDFIDQYGFHDDLEEKYHTNTESSPYFQIEMRRSSSKPLTTTRYSKFPSTSFLKSSRVLEKSYSTQSEKQKKQDLKLNHQLLL